MTRIWIRKLFLLVLALALLALPAQASGFRNVYGWANITYDNTSVIAEAAGTNASAIVTIVSPAGVGVVIDYLAAGYVGGSASFTMTIVSGTTTINQTVTNVPGAPQGAVWGPVSGTFPGGTNVVITLPAGGSAIIGFVHVLYHLR